ncbi:hypothetical protein C8J57DRAFT_1327862 [Mycena rebaudengoi]|nr:hypothetical protein C8J57DRAFT_1327862 [Mycena rebaudengoi]
MRLLRSFSASCSRRSRRPCFDLSQNADRSTAFLFKKGAQHLDLQVKRDAKVTSRVFQCHFKPRHGLHGAHRITSSSSKLQDPESAKVEDLSAENIFRAPRTTVFPHELAILVLSLPFGVSPNTPKAVVRTVQSPGYTIPRTPHRRFHSRCVSLENQAFPRFKTLSLPKPIITSRPTSSPPQAPEKISVPEKPVGWGLLPPPVREPTFWRPTKGDLKLPAREEMRPVPPVRPSKAGVAYKSILPRKWELHSSALWSSRPNEALARSMYQGGQVKLDDTVLASRARTLFRVQDAIRRKYGKEYSVQLFGSTRYGISSSNSDLDMVLLDPARKYGFLPDAKKTLPAVYNIRTLAKTLQKAGFRVTEALPKARVPIVKFTDPVTGHVCDINVNERLGLMNSDLIKRYCQLSPALVQMLVYIKKWAKPLGHNFPSSTKKGVPVTFSSYALVLMTIGFLQHRALLPNLQEGLPPLDPGFLHGTWWLRDSSVMCCDVRFKHATGWVPLRTVPSVSELMQDWFKFWAEEFDVKTQALSTRHGGPIPRSTFPDEDFRGILWNIDPFIRTKNVTQNISRDGIRKFQLDCHRYAAMPDFERGDLPPTEKKKMKRKRVPETPAPVHVEDSFGLQASPISAWSEGRDSIHDLVDDVTSSNSHVALEEDIVVHLQNDATGRVSTKPDQPILDGSDGLPSEWSQPLSDEISFTPIPLDDYGRPVRPPPPPRGVVSEEPEVDHVGFGLKS